VTPGWLSAGAITLGVGAALLAGPGIAHADGTGSGHSRGSSSSSGHARAEKKSGGSHTAPTTRRPADSTSPDPSRQPGHALTHFLHHVVAHAMAEVHGIVAAAPQHPRSAVVAALTVARSVEPVAAKVAPTAAVAVATASPVAAIPVAAPPVAPPLEANPLAGLLGEVISAVNMLVTPNPAAPLANPVQLAAFEVVRRIEMKLGLPVAGAATVATSDPLIGGNPVSVAPGVPSPTDVVQTVYGDIGKWLLEPGGQISDFGGEVLGGKELLEPVNVIILDPTSTTSAEATEKLDTDLGLAGFPAQPVHTTGFQGIVGDQTFGQQPAGLLEAFSDNLFLLPDDHARAFGAAPLPDGSGFVSTVAVSREQFGFIGLLPTHTLVSFDAARDELASRLIAGGATLVGIIGLGNAVDSNTETTGDADGYAIVIQLND